MYRWCNLLFGFVIVITMGVSIPLTTLEWTANVGFYSLVNGTLIE